MSSNKDIEEEKDVVEDTSSVEVPQHPLLVLADALFLLSAPADAEYVTGEERTALRAKLEAAIDEHDMSYYYKYLISKHGFASDAARLSALEVKNAAAIVAADVKIQEAKDVAGDSEVCEAMMARAQLYVKWGAHAESIASLALVLDATVGVASKIDVLTTKMRVALAFTDIKQYKTDLDAAKVYVDMRSD
jgi:hypothetical protein